MRIDVRRAACDLQRHWKIRHSRAATIQTLSSRTRRLRRHPDNHGRGVVAKFDMISAPPEMILAKERRTPDVPWPGRSRPLCPFPKFAAYKGSGDIEDAGNFERR